MRFYASGVPDTEVYYLERRAEKRARGIISTPIRAYGGVARVVHEAPPPSPAIFFTVAVG